MANDLKNMRDMLKGIGKKTQKSQPKEDRHTLRRASLMENMTPDQIKNHKWERIFYTFFDINRNHVIDWNDFEMLFEKIKEIRGENSTEYKIVSDAMRYVWLGLLNETQGIDRASNLTGEEEVTIDEWKGAWARFNPSHLPIWQWAYIKYMFFLIDMKGDKKIDVKEYVAAMGIYGLGKDLAEEAFAKMAKDSDGKPTEYLSYGDFVQLWNDYFTSGEKTNPGNYLFGPW